MVNSILSSLILQEFYKDHKRTWQEVSNVFLHYITITSFVLNYICCL